MKYLLSCKCGQTVEIEPNQAGQTISCACGERLLIPSMLQIKALPIAPEKQEPPKEKRKTVPFKAALINLTLGIVSAIAWGTLYSLENNLPQEVFLYTFFGMLPLMNVLSRGLTFAFGITAVFFWVRELVKSPLAEDTTMRRTFFVLGIALLFPGFFLISFLYEWQPQPHHATYKRKFFSYGSYQRLLLQDSTPIPQVEIDLLWTSDEMIDRMQPMQLHLFFRTLEEPPFSYDFQDNYAAVKDTYRIWVTGSIILLILGHLSIAVSFFMPRQEVVVTGWSGSEWR